MNLDVERLQAVAKPRSEESKRKAQQRLAGYGWRKKSQDVALAVLHYLRINKITQKELAEKMGVSAPHVAKLLKGTENLTLETIDKIEEALEQEFVHINRPYETVVAPPFKAMPDIQMTDRCDGFSGKTVSRNYSNFYPQISNAV